MRANLVVVVMFAFRFITRSLVPLMPLTLCTVICGLHPYLVSVVSNTTSLFLTIAPTTCGCFLFVRSPTHSPLFLIFFSFVATQFSTSIKSVQCDNGREFDNSSSRSFFALAGLCFACPAPTLPSKMVRLNALFALSTISSTPSCFRVIFLLLFGLRLFMRPPIFLIATLPKLLIFPRLIWHSKAAHPLTLTFVSSAVGATLTPLPLLRTDWPLGLLCVSSLAIHPTTKGYRCIDVTTNRILISRHVVFDESSFPFAEAPTPSAPTNLEFLDEFPSQDTVWVPPASHGATPRRPPGGPPPGFPPRAGAASTSAPGAGAGPGPAGPTAGAGPLTPGGLLPPPPPRPPPPPGLPRPGPTSAASLGLPASSGPTGASPGLAHGDSLAAEPGLQQPLAPGLQQVSSSNGPWHWAVPPDVNRVRSARLPWVPSAPPLIPAGGIPVPPVVNSHGMRTRAKGGFRQPRLNLQAVALLPVPSSYRHALDDPNWRHAMEDEFQALVANNTWTLVRRPPLANIVTDKWIFKHKLHSDGSLNRYKARWVLRGFTQRPGIDYDETFSPVIKPATIHIVLSIALSGDWPVHQLDVNNAFLHGTLTETV
jgi:hypothetical protein